MLSLLLALSLSAQAQDWDRVYERSTTVALSGAAPGSLVGLAGVTASTTLLLPEDTLGPDLREGAEGLGAVAVMGSPISVVGTGMLAGGSLRARRALEEKGASVSGLGGGLSWGLLGTTAVLGGIGLQTESRGLLTAASWTLVGAQVAGSWQLSANYRAHSTLGERTWEDRYEQGRTAYRSGLVSTGLGLVSALGGAGLVYVYVSSIDKARKPLEKLLLVIVLAPVAAVGFGGLALGAGTLTLGPGMMGVGSLRSRNALTETGQSVSSVAGWTSVGLLVGSAPVLVTGLLLEEPALYVATGAMWLGAVGLAMVQMEQSRRVYVDVDVQQERRIDLPPLTVRF